MNRKDENKIRAGRREIGQKAKKARAKHEHERFQKAANDINSPTGFGPLWESVSPHRHTTPDPWDKTAPEQMRPWSPFKKGPFEP